MRRKRFHWKCFIPCGHFQRDDDSAITVVSRRIAWSGSRLDDIVDDMSMNVRQSALDTVVVEAESFMIES